MDSKLEQNQRIDLQTDDGMRLRARRYGQGSGQPVLLLHGMGQTAESWQSAATALAAAGADALALDFRGHGGSDWASAGQYALQDLQHDVAAGMAVFEQAPVLVGASMGGLLALLSVAEQSERNCRGLVLVDITPRWQDEGIERIIAFMRAKPDGFADLNEAQALIAEYLPHRSPKSPERLKKLLEQGDDGRWRWHWDPALLDQVEAEADSYSERLMNAARSLRVPTLLISGARSDVVSADTIKEFLEAVPHARHVDVAHATHMVAGDDNSAFNSALLEFVEELSAQASNWRNTGS